MDGFEDCAEDNSKMIDDIYNTLTNPDVLTQL